MSRPAEYAVLREKEAPPKRGKEHRGQAALLRQGLDDFVEFILREGSQRLGAHIALGANRESEARHRLIAVGLDMGHEVVVPQG